MGGGQCLLPACPGVGRPWCDGSFQQRARAVVSAGGVIRDPLGPGPDQTFPSARRRPALRRRRAAISYEDGGAPERESVHQRVRLSDQPHAGGVEVVTNRITVRARRAIVTLPPALAGRIRFDPPLPASRDHLTQSTAALTRCDIGA